MKGNETLTKAWFGGDYVLLYPVIKRTFVSLENNFFTTFFCFLFVFFSVEASCDYFDLETLAYSAQHTIIYLQNHEIR